MNKCGWGVKTLVRQLHNVHMYIHMGQDFLLYISVLEWKYIIASAFKLKLLRRPEAAGCSPDHKCQGYSQLGRNKRRLVDIFILAVALTIMVRATASWAETSSAWWIFFIKYIQVKYCSFQISIAAPQVRQYFVQANKAKRAGTNKMVRVMVRAPGQPTKKIVSNFSIYKQKSKKFMNTKLLRIYLYTNCEEWRRMDYIFNIIPILWRLKHMCIHQHKVLGFSLLYLQAP